MSTDSPSENEEVAAAATPEAPVVPETPDVPETPEVPETAAPESTVPELTIGSGTGSVPDADYVPVLRGKIDRHGVAMGTGRRKTSVARVRIKPGTGTFVVNGKPLNDYLVVERDQAMCMAPIRLLEKEGAVDVSIRVSGGGTTGQTGAIVLGIGRALQGMFPESHHELSSSGFLSRDSRMVERKKYGLRKARRSFQFSKR